MELNQPRNGAERRLGKSSSAAIGTRLSPATFSRLRSGDRQDSNVSLCFSSWSLSTRRVEIGGVASRVNGLWMTQIARNLTDDVDGFLKGKRYLIHDRDPLYAGEFLSMLADAGIQSVRLPPRSPNLNAYAERFVRSIKEGCLERMIFFGEDSLRNAVCEFVTHYNC